LPGLDLPTTHLPNIAKIIRVDVDADVSSLLSWRGSYAKTDDPERITSKPEVGFTGGYVEK